MTNLFIKLIQTALNKGLRLDPETHEQLKKLDNKVVTIDLNVMNLIFQLQFLNSQVMVHTHNHLKADTTIKGTPLRLLQMSLSKHKQGFFADDITINGDLEVGQQITKLFDHLHIDWEEYLSHWIGDFAANQLGQMVSRIKSAAKTAQQTVRENISEYVHEEINLSPTPEALNDFFEDVDELRMDTDRMTARIQLLEKNLLKKRGLS
jgi:ubiquinone biosynthesis protein UbiJ